MKRDLRNKSNIPIIAMAVLLILVAAVLIYILRRPEKEQTTETETAPSQKEELIEQTLSDVSKEDVKGLLFSMYSLETYNVEDLLTYRGIHSIMLPAELESGEEMLRFLSQTMAQPQYLRAVYVGVKKEESPLLEADCIRGGGFQVFENIYRWEEGLLDFIRSYPDIRFHIMTEYPAVSELAAMSDIQRYHLYNWYRSLAEMFTPTADCQNMIAFLPGAEEWLVCNGANYLENGAPNKEAAKYIFGQMTCMDRYSLDTSNCEERIGLIEEMVQAYREPALLDTEYTFVFLGDSVIGNYTDSMSIPGVVGSYTDARIINCGFGGLPAAKIGDNQGMSTVIDAIVQENPQGVTNSVCQAGIARLVAEKEEINQEKLVFLLCFGINDYASGNPLSSDMLADISTYKGAFEYAVAMLKAKYPACEVILVTPNLIKWGNFGTDASYGMVYEDYVDVVIGLSEELNLKCIDVYHNLGANKENADAFLEDDCHPDQNGRYQFGKLIFEHLAKWYFANE